MAFGIGRRTRRTAVLGAIAAGIILVSSGCVATEPKENTDAQLSSIAERLVEAGYPGVIATRTDADGTIHTATGGYADIAAKTSIPQDAEVRIGSASKTFTAVIILQLVQEGKLSLEDSVQSILPGVVSGDGIDPSAITVLHLLQHTSGLPEYADIIAADPFAAKDTYWSPREILDVALERPASFPAGQQYEYSNSGYLVLGLIAEKVAQKPIQELVNERIVEPLGLDHTYFPEPKERDLRDLHPNGYHVTTSGVLEDITAADPSWTWAAGAMVSTPAELNEFMRALLNGELLDAKRMQQMTTGVATGEELLPGSTYGLGIESVELSCGTAWGHSGDIPGFQTRNAVAEDGTAFTVTATALPFAIFDGPEEELLDRYLVVIDTLDEAICGTTK